MSKIIFFMLLLGINFGSTAQITKVTLQASGLTCSMCNKSIYKSLSTITNVSTIESDINNNMFTILFKDVQKVDLDELKKKVEVAGYKVAKLYAFIEFNNNTIKNDTHVTNSNSNFHFMNVKEQTLTGTVKVQILDKGFTTTKEYKQNNQFTKMDCYKTGYMGNCCTTKTTANKQRIYHITLA